MSPKGLGDARPTAMKMIADEDHQNKWLDKTALIIGASSGIGIETTRAHTPLLPASLCPPKT